MRKKIGIVESAMRHWQILFLITSLLVLFGGYALFNMPKQEFPKFTIRQGLVIGVYPGATSAEVEEQLTTAVERYLFSFKEIKKEKTYSHSKDGMMIIYVELNDDVNNADEFWSKLKHGLSTFKSQLPSGVLALIADNDFGDTSALLITLESDNKSYRELETYLNKLEDRLRRIQSVSNLRHYGLEKEQISIYLEKEKLTNYGISSSTLLANLFTQGFTTTSGSVDNSQFIAPIHVSKSYSNENDIAEQIIYSDPAGNIIRLKDVARVVREYPKPDNYINNNGKKCLLISMEMQQGNNIVQYGRDVDKVLKEFQKELPQGVSIERIADQPKVVGNSITTFLKELLYAIIAVILVTMALLPLRVASVAASTIPITIFISLGIMYLTGIELNTVTLAGLIVVLGMIVDNSIVIVDSYMDKLDHGISRWNASISSAKGFFKAIFSATLAISITFFPFLATLKGMFGDFVKLFPWTVSITLGISLLVAMLLIPFIQYLTIKKGFLQLKDSKKNKKRNFLDIVQSTYEKWLIKAFNHPRLTLILGGLSIFAGIIIFFQIPQRLMPIAERDQFAIEIYLPQGNSLNQTAMVADSLKNILKKDKRIKSITSFIGTSSPRFHTSYAPNMPAKNYAQFIVNTTSQKATIQLLDEYSDKYADLFPNAHIRFKQLDYQPSTAPIEVRVSGDSIADLKIAADSLAKRMQKIDGLVWVRTNFEEMLPGMQVDIDPVEANRLGITKTTVATNLAMRFDGLPITTLWEKDYPVSVKLKAEREGDVDYNEIENEYIHSLIPGVSVPLRQIAKVKPDWNQGQIVRRNGVPTISVYADVERGINTNTVFSKVKKIAEKCPLPKGTSLSYGGAYESDAEALPQIIGGLMLSIIIIFLILLFHFKRINLALLVMGSASLSLLGAAIGVIVMKLEFGITAILGIVSLIGILVRNGIIMIDYAEELRFKYKKTIREAAMEAGKRRMRPIFLTSAAASMGVIPMIISRSALWGPMGTVICFGTLTSMVLLVFILPVAYWLIFKRVDKKKEKKKAKTLLKEKMIKATLVGILLVLGLNNYVSAQNKYSLEQCKTLALQNNALIKNSNLEIEASKQVKDAAFTKYFPSLNAQAMSFRFTDPLVKMSVPGGNLPVYDGNPANLATATQFAYFPGMSFSGLDKINTGVIAAVQPLYAGSRISNGNKLANLGIEVSSEKSQLNRNEVLLKTEEQYWQIVSLNEKMNTINSYEKLLDALYKEVNNAFQNGLITHNDLLKVKLKQSEVKMNKLKLDNGQHLALMAFCQYIGVKYDSLLVLSDSVVNISKPTDVFINHYQALTNRVEYQLLQKSIEAETYQTKLKRGEYLPELAVGAGAMYLGMDEKDNNNAFVMASLKIPVSDWWEASHTLKERKLKEQIAKNNVDNTSELLIVQMQKAWNELQEADREIAVAEETVAQAEENLKLNNDSYKSGMVNVSDLLEAQALLQNAKDQLTDVKTNYQNKLVAYMQVTGRY
jgi:multidrug efflux pump subunit AcrB/outer membrane protein TolC